jgi:hypothetical protein
VRARRTERHAARGAQLEQAAAHVALARDGVVEVLATAGADLDLAGDQLARDRGRERVVAGRRVAQLLEPRHEVQRVGVEDRELLLEPDRPVFRGSERLRRAVQVEGHRRGT